jgi:hypothetical protein
MPVISALWRLKSGGLRPASTVSKKQSENERKKEGRKERRVSLVLVAHACNPSYSGGRDQEDHGLKPARANSFRDPILRKPITKKGWWSGSRFRP